MTDGRPLRMTVEEYFAFDHDAPEGMRYEYWDGVVVPVHGYDPRTLEAMVGASPEHNQIALNLAAALHDSMTARGCRGATSDQRVPMEPGRYGYPDLAFVCDEPVYTDDVPPTLENPTLLIELASPSTGDRDRSKKMAAYTRLASLREYWVVEPDAPAVPRVLRTPDGWGLRFVRGLDADLASDDLGVSVPLADVHRLVDLDAY